MNLYMSDSELSLRRIATAVEHIEALLAHNRSNEKVCRCSSEGCSGREPEGSQTDRGEPAQDGQDERLFGDSK
jgi:hypothetical protein